jgi:hypothetical protein
LISSITTYNESIEIVAEHRQGRRREINLSHPTGSLDDGRNEMEELGGRNGRKRNGITKESSQ